MGHYCRICGETRANEAFSGRGHRTHVCKECAALPMVQRDAIDHEREIFDLLSQSRISAKNIGRLKLLQASEDPHICLLASIVLDVARVRPSMRGRLSFLKEAHPHLFAALEETGLILDYDADEIEER